MSPTRRPTRDTRVSTSTAGNYQRAPSSPNEDTEVTLRKKLTHTERELSLTRRYLHRLQREVGRPLTKFFSMPRYGKLRYRPIVLGFAPSSGARSGLPFDDEFGDNLCEVAGLVGFHQMLVNFKVRNVFLHPADDLPHVERGRIAMDRAIASHVSRRLFDGRVVIVVGNDARRACGIDVTASFIGPVTAPAIADAALVLTIPDIGHPKQWPRERRNQLLDCFAFAMAAARLPCEDPLAEAVALQAGESTPAWASIAYKEFPRAEKCERALDLWIRLIAAGLAAPPDLTRGAWLPRGDGAWIFLADKGIATITGGPAEARVTVYEYVAGTEAKLAHDRAVFTWFGKRGDCRRRAEDHMLEHLRWNYPFMALDQRLEQMRS